MSSFFHRGLFRRKPLACLCLHVSCQCSSCFLPVQSMITPLATFADMSSPGLGPISGCEEPCLANSSAISFPPVSMCPGTHPNWILLCTVSFTSSDDGPRLIWNLSGSCQGLGSCLTVGNDTDVPTCVALFFILLYTSMFQPGILLCGTQD